MSYKNTILTQLTPVNLDRPRRLLVTLNALAEIEEVTGKSILKPGSWSTPTAKNLFAMLAAFSRFEDPGVTAQTIARSFSMERMPEIMKAMTTAWNRNAAGTPADGDSKSFPPASSEMAEALALTGSPSGA